MDLSLMMKLFESIGFPDDSAVIGSNLAYAAIHQLGGQAGKNKKVTILARPYLKLTDDDYNEILKNIKNFCFNSI